MSNEEKNNFRATALLLNWKRHDNLLRLIAAIRDQSVPVEILLWNNSDNTTRYDVDLQINSSANLMCWPRWMMASFASAEFVFVIDDDIMPRDNQVVSDCIKYCIENPLTAIGYTGVILNSRKKYWSSKHLAHPARNIDTHVDIIKGRFMFMPKCLLQQPAVLPHVSLLDPRVEDDILISSLIRTKVLPRFLVKRLTRLPEGDVALCSQPAHRQSRKDAVKRYFCMNPHNVSAQEWGRIYATGGWRRRGSGPGSRLAVNGKLINFLKKLIVDRQIRSLVDLGCGDLQWAPQVIADLESYIGIDCVPLVIERNRIRFPQHKFLVMDLLHQELPNLTCDLLFCKDLFHHLIAHQELLLSKIEKIKARYKVIVIPDTTILRPFRQLLEAAGWVNEMEYFADENKILYGKNNETDQCLGTDPQ